jgi:hypothetical protein
VNSPVSIGRARPIAARVSGSCGEAAWCAALSQTSVTQMTSSSVVEAPTMYERHPA